MRANLTQKGRRDRRLKFVGVLFVLLVIAAGGLGGAYSVAQSRAHALEKAQEAAAAAAAKPDPKLTIRRKAKGEKNATSRL